MCTTSSIVASLIYVISGWSKDLGFTGTGHSAGETVFRKLECFARENSQQGQTTFSMCLISFMKISLNFPRLRPCAVATRDKLWRSKFCPRRTSCRKPQRFLLVWLPKGSGRGGRLAGRVYTPKNPGKGLLSSWRRKLSLLLQWNRCFHCIYRHV